MIKHNQMMELHQHIRKVDKTKDKYKKIQEIEVYKIQMTNDKYNSN